jgi:hypothetical protein
MARVKIKEMNDRVEEADRDNTKRRCCCAIITIALPVKMLLQMMG